MAHIIYLHTIIISRNFRICLSIEFSTGMLFQYLCIFYYISSFHWSPNDNSNIDQFVNKKNGFDRCFYFFFVLPTTPFLKLDMTDGMIMALEIEITQYLIWKHAKTQLNIFQKRGGNYDLYISLNYQKWISKYF